MCNLNKIARCAMKRWGWIITGGFLGLVALGIYVRPERNPPKTDIAKLKSIVQLLVPAEQVRWEIFSEPEFATLALGPSDYTTLLVEILPSDPTWFARQSADSKHLWIAPDTERAWLRPYFRWLMTSPKQSVKGVANCKDHTTAMTTSGRIVRGFVCDDDGILLMHLVLSGAD